MVDNVEAVRRPTLIRPDANRIDFFDEEMVVKIELDP